MADLRAKIAAEHSAQAMNNTYQREASLSRMTGRLRRPSKLQATQEWITYHVKLRQGFKPPRGSRLRQEFPHERKALTSRYYRLLSVYTATRAPCAIGWARRCRTSTGGAARTNNRPATTSSSSARLRPRNPKRCGGVSAKRLCENTRGTLG